MSPSFTSQQYNLKCVFIFLDLQQGYLQKWLEIKQEHL